MNKKTDAKILSMFGLTARAGRIASGEFRADVDPATVVSLMRYWIGGMTLHWCIEEGGFDPYAVADELMDVVLKHLV